MTAAGPPPVFERRAPRRARRDVGRARRELVPIAAHADGAGGEAGGGRSALAILRAQDARRVASLVPIRYGRMSATPFTFYRGAAAVMAVDLAATPHTDLTVQLCGDAHLSNFGAFAAADRRLVFDLNDFDETLPGPFEWDVKRLAASTVVAACTNGFGTGRTADAARAAVSGYRRVIARAARMDPLDVWYFRVEVDTLADLTKGRKGHAQVSGVQTKAGRKDRLGALAKLTEVVDGRRRIRARPPLVVPFAPDRRRSELDRVGQFVVRYQESLRSERRTLLARYAVSDVALKVVGVGSVGTRCLIVLLESGDDHPLFLQLKEATDSVFGAHLPPSAFANAGQRVVEGQRMLQSATDSFLGWSRYAADVGDVDFYIRQLWDGKASMAIEDMSPKVLANYAALCGAVLARAHARSGDAAMIDGYLGGAGDDSFDEAIVAFAVAYAGRNGVDHRALVAAIQDGELEAARDL